MFYMVVRIFHTNKDNHSVEYFREKDYESRRACLRAAEARFHNIITADLNNPEVVYQMAYIMDANGNFVERPVIFDREDD